MGSEERGAPGNSLGFSTGYWDRGGVSLESGENRELAGRNTSKVRFVALVAGRQLSKSKYISAPPPPRPGPGAHGSHGSHPHQQSQASHPSAPGELGEPLPPNFLCLVTPSPSSEPALRFLPHPPRRKKTKTNSSAPCASHPRTPLLPEQLLATSVGGSISPPTPDSGSSVTLPLAPRLPRPSRAPPPHRETAQKRAEKKFWRKVGLQEETGELAGRRGGEAGRSGPLGRGESGVGWGKGGREEGAGGPRPGMGGGEHARSGRAGAAGKICGARWGAGRAGRGAGYLAAPPP